MFILFVHLIVEPLHVVKALDPERICVAYYGGILYLYVYTSMNV